MVDDAEEAIGDFLIALEAVPGPGPANEFRGVPLIHRDEQVRSAISRLGGVIADPGPVEALWEHALTVPPWSGQPAGFTATYIQATL